MWQKIALAAGLVLIIGVAIMFFLRGEVGAPSHEAVQDHSSSAVNENQPTLSGNEAEAVETNSVEINQYAYAPQVITVKKGTKVTWTNQDSVRHDIMPDQETEIFKPSELLAKGQSYSVTFDSAGTYTYYCSPHPYMKGTIIVTE